MRGTYFSKKVILFSGLILLSYGCASQVNPIPWEDTAQRDTRDVSDINKDESESSGTHDSGIVDPGQDLSEQSDVIDTADKEASDIQIDNDTLDAEKVDAGHDVMETDVKDSDVGDQMVNDSEVIDTSGVDSNEDVVSQDSVDVSDAVGDSQGNDVDSVNTDAPDVQDMQEDLKDSQTDHQDAMTDVIDAQVDQVDTSEDVQTQNRVVGQFVLSWWQEDSEFNYPELYAHGVFSTQLASMNLADVVGWMSMNYGYDVFVPQDAYKMPGPGEKVEYSFDELLEPQESPVYMDAGTYVLFGDVIDCHVVEELQSKGIYVYDMLEEDGAEIARHIQPGSWFDMKINGGKDITAFSKQRAVYLPEPIKITNYDQSMPMPIRYGRPIVVKWQPDTTEDTKILINVETEDGGVAALFDESEGTKGVDLEQLIGPDVSLWAKAPYWSVSLQRIWQGEVQLASNKTEVIGKSTVWLYPEKVGPYKITPRVWPVNTKVSVKLGVYDGSFDKNGQISITPQMQVSNVKVLDSMNSIITFDVTVPQNAPTGPITIKVPRKGRAPLVISNAVFVAKPLENAGDCESSVAEGVVDDGTYFATDEGLGAGAFPQAEAACGKNVATGREQAIPIHLTKGERLDARLYRDKCPGVLYLVPSCSEDKIIGNCAVAAGDSHDVKLTYTAMKDEDLLLVVDSQCKADSKPDNYVITIKRYGPLKFVVNPAYLIQGTPTDMTLSLINDTFNPNDQVTVYLGDDVTVSDIQVDPNEPSILHFKAKAKPYAIVGYRDLKLKRNNNLITQNKAVYVEGWLDVPDKCDDAKTIGPGIYTGVTYDMVFDGYDASACGDNSHLGPETAYRVDLGPGQTLRAWVTTDFDAVVYLVPDCKAKSIECVDNASEGGTEYLEWTGPDQASSVLIVIDGFDTQDEGNFTLKVEVTQ